MQTLYQLIYNPFLNYILRNLNKVFEFLFKSKLKIPPSGIITLKTDSGHLKMATNQTSYLTQLLFWNGYKKFEYSELFEQLSKRTSVFLDIGSNIGYYSLLAAKSNPQIKVFAFEPAMGPKHYLKENIHLNNFQSQIKALDVALSNTIGTIDFFEVKSLKYKNLSHNLAGEGNAGTKTKTRNFVKNRVEATTLSAFVQSENLNQIDLIKIDTEGTEIDILNSGKEFIEKFQPIAICETLFNTIENELEVFFKELDYEFYNHTSKGLTKVQTIKRTDDDGIRNCFFVPKSKVELISEFII
ncbi:MAG: FkbM family methyltransferase [Gelidibacter sp.]